MATERITQSQTAFNQELNWEVKSSNIYSQNRQIEGFQALSRDDNGQVLSIMRKSYHPTPNSRLVGVVDKLSEITGFEKEGFSEFRNGRLVLGYLKAEQRKVVEWDTQEHLVIGNSHDGTTGFFIGTTQIMIRCMNAFSRIHKKMKVYHTSNHDVKIDDLISAFRVYREETKRLSQRMEKFHRTKIDEKVIVALTERLLRIDGGLEDALDKGSTRKKNIIEQFRSSIDREVADLGPNLLGLFNGVTHYTTHVKKGESVFGSVAGEGARMNRVAFDVCNGYAF